MTQSITLPSTTPNVTSSIPTLNFLPNTLIPKTNEGHIKHSPPFGTVNDLRVHKAAMKAIFLLKKTPLTGHTAPLIYKAYMEHLQCS